MVVDGNCFQWFMSGKLAWVSFCEITQLLLALVLRLTAWRVRAFWEMSSWEPESS
jgi:hypothetical protein